MGSQHLVWFDGEDTYSGDCSRGAFLTICAVLGQGEYVVRILRIDAVFLLPEASQPSVASRVGGSYSGEE